MRTALCIAVALATLVGVSLAEDGKEGKIVEYHCNNKCGSCEEEETWDLDDDNKYCAEGTSTTNPQTNATITTRAVGYECNKEAALCTQWERYNNDKCDEKTRIESLWCGCHKISDSVSYNISCEEGSTTVGVKVFREDGKCKGSADEDYEFKSSCSVDDGDNGHKITKGAFPCNTYTEVSYTGTKCKSADKIGEILRAQDECRGAIDEYHKVVCPADTRDDPNSSAVVSVAAAVLAAIAAVMM